MYIELYWKDYKRFGGEGSVDALSRWLMSRLTKNYGEAIETLCITGFCRSLTGPNNNSTSLFERFELVLAKLRERPAIRYSAKKRELAIDYAAVWPTADEFQPDSLMMKVGTFRRSYLKIQTLLKQADAKLGSKLDFNFAEMINDIEALEPELPKTLHELATLYLANIKNTGEQKSTPNH